MPVYRGKFGPPQAERLLWRAGFGPRPGEAEALAKKGLDGAVHSLLNPGAEKLVGPTPHDDKGRPLAPRDAWGHDHCWWLDRMVRTSRPLVERMTLVWHDWFATSNDGVGNQGLMIGRTISSDSTRSAPFDRLLLDVTKDPAMLMWLNGTDNRQGLAERELRARDDGALHARRRPRCVHRARRARASARADRVAELAGRKSGVYNFRFDREAARPRHEDRLPQGGPLRLARRLPALRHASTTRLVLRLQALELLRPDRSPIARRLPGSRRCTGPDIRSRRSSARS